MHSMNKGWKKKLWKNECFLRKKQNEKNLNQYLFLDFRTINKHFLKCKQPFAEGSKI